MLAKEAAIQQTEYEEAVKYNVAVAARERKEQEKKQKLKEVRRGVGAPSFSQVEGGRNG